MKRFTCCQSVLRLSRCLNQKVCAVWNEGKPALAQLESAAGRHRRRVTDLPERTARPSEGTRWDKWRLINSTFSDYLCAHWPNWFQNFKIRLFDSHLWSRMWKSGRCFWKTATWISSVIAGCAVAVNFWRQLSQSIRSVCVCCPLRCASHQLWRWVKTLHEDCFDKVKKNVVHKTIKKTRQSQIQIYLHVF